MTRASALYVGQVMHRRMRPRVHRLRYRIFSVLLDLDEIDGISAELRLFSRNRFNVFSFHDRDYAGKTAEPLRAQIERLVTDADVDSGGGPIRLLTMPRILGFAFNPLSIYFCHRVDGALTAIVYEVNNTCGEHHSYVLAVEPLAGMVRQSCAKQFHVSPFMAMDMRYAFRVTPPGARLAVAITGSDANGALITAVHTARRRPLSDAALLRAFFTHPLLTLKVAGGIGWEAFKLWTKGVPVHARPAPPAPVVSSANPPKATACI